MICPGCNNKTNSIKTIIYKNKLTTGCSKCLPSQTRDSGEFSAKNSREHMKKTYRRDLLQPSDRAFAREFPAEAKKIYSDEQLRKFG